MPLQIKESAYIYILAGLITGFFLLVPHLSPYLYNLDEGTILNSAWRMHNGQKLYQDFPSNFGPLTLEFYKQIFSVFGVSYVASKVASLIGLIVATLALYYTTFKISNNALTSWLATTIFALTTVISLPVIGHNSLSIYCILVSLSLFYFRLSKQSTWWLDFLIGILSGVSVFFLSTRGGAGFLVMIFLYSIYFGKQNLKPLLKFILSFTLSIFVGTLYWGTGWITTPIEMFSAYNSVANYLPIYPLLVTVLMSLAIALIIFRRTKSDLLRKHVVALALTSVFLNLSVLNLPDLPHLVSVMFPSFILASLVFILFIQKYSTIIQFYLLSVLLISLVSLWIIFLFDALNLSANNKYFEDLKKIIGNETLLVYPFGETHYFVTRQSKPLDISIPDFYAEESPYLKTNVEMVYSNPPTYIIEQTNYLMRYQLTDPYLELKQNCYQIFRDYSAEKIYKKSNQNCTIESPFSQGE